jgi:hypothetical protein
MEPDRPWADILAVEEADRDRDAEDREDIRRFRRDFGLPADDEVVEHFLAEYKAGRQEEGMWLSPEEWGRYERQDELQTQAQERLSGYLTEHADSVAGVWLGAGLDPEYNIALTGDVDAHRVALLRLFPRPDVIRVHLARYSEAELEAISDRITEESDELEALGVKWMGSGVDVEANCVEVEVVASDEESARGILEDRYGAAVTVEWLGTEDWVREMVPWQLWTIDESGRSLTVHYATFRAYQLERAECQEDEHEVAVKVFVRAPHSVKTIGATFEATVELERPLGDRRVIDGATGRLRERRIPMEVYERSREVIRAYAAQHPDEYGGSWTEYPGCHVAFTSNVDAHREAMLDLLPESRVLVVHEVERTEAELLELGERVARERGLLRARGIHCTDAPYLYSDDNAMFIEIEAKDCDAAVRFMAERYGPGLMVACMPA